MMFQMNRRRAAAYLLVAGAFLAASVAPRATAQSASPEAAKPLAHPTAIWGSGAASQTAAKPAAASTSKPGEEGLTVHGYWKIDVHNTDGKLVAHREFENSLAASGALPLYQLITGQAAAGDMAIAIYDPAQPDICDGVSGNTCYLIISESTGIGGKLCAGANAARCTAGLTETTNSTSGAVTLSGNVLAAQATTITNVSTLLITCSSGGSGYTTVAPTQCFSLPAAGTAGVNSPYGSFTGTTLPTSLPVNAGQTVSFQVVFTFS
jgi:hypothetical protein